MAAETLKLDRRIQRTMDALREALMALIIEKGYDAISIQDITDRANVARTTFYLHFKDKDDLMFRSMRAIYDQIVPSIATDNPLDALTSPSDFLHVERYFDFYTSMLSPRGSMAFLTRVRAYLQDVIEDAFVQVIPPGKQPNIPVKMLAAYCAGAQIGILWWWVEARMPIPAEKMAEMGMQIAVKGLGWALNNDQVK